MITGPSGPSENKIKDAGQGSASRRFEFHYLAVGRITRAHGIKGEVSMEILTDFPERFEATEWVYLGDENEAAPYRLESYRPHKKNLLLKLAGVTTRTQAEQLRRQFVQVPVEEAMPLPEGNCYLFQLIGLKVVTTVGETLGLVADVLETGANDVFIVEDGQRQILLPDIPDVVKVVDLENEQVVVELMAGLI